MIVAHRCNTYSEILRAIDECIKHIELDVHTRSDGTVVVAHDYDSSGRYQWAATLASMSRCIPDDVTVYVEIKAQSFISSTVASIKNDMGFKRWTPISFSRQIAQSFNMPYGWISTDPAIIDHQAALMIVSKDNVTQPLPELRNGAKWMVYTCNNQADIDLMRAMGADYIETDDVCLQ